MAAQYDAIATQYQNSRRSPLRTYVEAYSLLGMLGDVEGLNVLELGCGDGHYARLLKQRGAARVVGVDISAAMLEMARREERERPLGIEYRCDDVASMPDCGRFDLIVAAYLLHYAPDEQTLMQMLRNIARQLQPDGRFVAINENPEQPASACRGYDQYGFNKTSESPRVEGSRMTYRMAAGRELFCFDVYYFNRATYERCFGAAGLRDWRWRPLVLDPAGVDELGAEYWVEYMDNPPVIGIEAWR